MAQSLGLPGEPQHPRVAVRADRAGDEPTCS